MSTPPVVIREVPLPVEKSKHVRVGLYPFRVGPDGERKASVIKMDLTIESSDTKEQLLTYVEELKQCIIEHINENYDAFMVPGI
jgi:hypothetical protein